MTDGTILPISQKYRKLNEILSDGTLSKGVSLLLLCYIAIFMIDAVHILLLMRFCTNCIGKHRVNKK